jgi:FtsZ-binding cell division protein ZapB
MRSPTRNKIAEKDRQIALLELEVEAVKERCETYEHNMRDLKREMNKMVVKAHNKKDLRKKFSWNGNDNTYSDTVIKFCKVWLFPRYKFLQGNWMAYSDARKSLSSLVLKHCPIPPGADREDVWDRVVAPTIAKKYADMRCNITSDVRKALLGK